jgi:hypothetical protein
MRNMRTLKNLLFLPAVLLLVAACSSNDNDEPSQSEIENDTYKLSSIRFYLADGDGILDSLRCEKDTVVNNYSYTDTMFVKIADYTNDLKDSVSLKITQQTPAFSKPLNLVGQIEMPRYIENNEIHYIIENDTIRTLVNTIPTQELLPAYFVLGSGTHKTNLSPRMAIKLKNVYHYVHQQASFEAFYVGEQTGQTVAITGKWRYSALYNNDVNNAIWYKIDK